jgi:hypothetical protein
MTAKITLNNRVFRAIQLKNSNLYMGIGRTTAWPDEENPPEPADDSTSIEECLYLKKLIEKRLVIQDYNGELEFNGIYYTEVAEEDAYTQEAVSLFMRTTVHYGDISTSITYRQTGVTADPQKNSVILTGDSYLPAEWDDQGILHYISNYEKVQRDDSQSEQLAVLLDF